MSGAFDPNRKAAELPRATLVGLYRRTEDAHEALNRTWHEAVSDAYGPEVADAVFVAAWPEKEKGATARELFYGDLRFVVAATELQPDMLTVADPAQAELPNALTKGRGWFGRLITLARLVRSTSSRSDAETPPSWEGSPGWLRGSLRGRGVQLGFALLLKAWQTSQQGKALPFDVEDFEQEVEEQLGVRTLALLWNHAALAYMLSTDRWYTQIDKRYGADDARKLEKDVWVDRGAAEHDLQIGLDAIGAKGSNVETLLRGFQFAPGEVGIINVEFDLIDENHGVLTHHTCPALDRFEHFDEARRKHCCEICLAAMPISGEMLHPKIACKPLKLPPRADSDDIACRWEYTLSESG